MAKKILKAKFEDRCNGCELCILEAQRQMGVVGLTNSPIRILKDISGTNLYFQVEVDESISKLKLEEFIKICPTGVFEIMEVDDEALIN